MVLTDFEGDLRMLEDWLVNPRIEKQDFIVVAITKLKGMLDASIEEDNFFCFSNKLFV